MIRNTILPVFFLLLGVLLNQNALSGTVYQWTDEAGNINFSDVPPDESITAEKHEYDVEQDEESKIDLEQYSIINQAEKMAHWRRQLADERLAKRKLYLEEKRLAHEMELEISRQNQTIAAEEYAPRSYYYAPTQFSHRRRHGYDAYSHQKPIGNVPSLRNRNSLPRKDRPVHL
jgi:hypothetical protein